MVDSRWICEIICLANSLYVSRIHLEFAMKSLRIHHLLTKNSSFSGNFLRTHYLLRDFSLNSLSFFANSLSVSRIHFESTIFLEKPLWIRYETILKSLWIHYLLSDFSLDSLSFFANTLSVLRINLESTIFSAKPLWIRYEFAMKSLWNHFEFTICFAISLWIHYLFREFTLNPLSPAQSP